MARLRLFAREYGATSASAPPLLLVHGLLGSSVNWHGIARRLSDVRPVLVPDLRNHGRSPRAAEMSYPTMADDLAGLLDANGIEQAVVAGHSMGGKAAMWLALTRPERVQALVVADMAPVAYPSGFERLLDALLGLDLAHLQNRAEADSRLARMLPTPGLRAYLLQNLVRKADAWEWRANLSVLAASIDDIIGFPDAAGRQYAGPTLFLYGTESSYVTQAQLPAIHDLFPHARLRAVPGAGHWVYSDRPDVFVSAVRGFLQG
jgi:esterase